MESAFKRNLEVLLSKRERGKPLLYLKNTMRISPLGSESMEQLDGGDQGGMSMDDLDSGESNLPRQRPIVKTSSLSHAFLSLQS